MRKTKDDMERKKRGGKKVRGRLLLAKDLW